MKGLMFRGEGGGYHTWCEHLLNGHDYTQSTRFEYTTVLFSAF